MYWHVCFAHIPGISVLIATVAVRPAVLTCNLHSFDPGPRGCLCRIAAFSTTNWTRSCPSCNNVSSQRDLVFWYGFRITLKVWHHCQAHILSWWRLSKVYICQDPLALSNSERSGLPRIGFKLWFRMKKQLPWTFTFPSRWLVAMREMGIQSYMGV